jgi:cholera toxin transcriptional activator
MTNPPPAQVYRFGVFEADAATGELRRKGVRVRLHAQPFQVLLMLLERPGELLTREEICRELWPEGMFVDYEHGVNSAVNRLRDALGDTANNPRFVETLARRGYRFLLPVERIVPGETEFGGAVEPPEQTALAGVEVIPEAKMATESRLRILATPEDLPKTPYPVVQTLFVLLQLMYVAFYVAALANLGEIEDILSPLAKTPWPLDILIVTAAILIPLRACMLCAVLFRAPGVREKLLKLWPFLFPLDVLWSLSPFLLLHHMDFGLALACTTLLVYSPFAQRSLILMGAGQTGYQVSTTSGN